MNWLLAVLAGMVAGAVLMRLAHKSRSITPPDPGNSVTRLDAHLASSSSLKVVATKSIGLRRDVQAKFESTEASHDLEVLDRVLVDIRDLTGADEAIFWRWVESRQTLVPNAWSTADDRPAYFDVRAWGPLLRWSAEEAMVQFAGDEAQPPVMAAAPVTDRSAVYGVLSVSGSHGLSLDRESSKLWMPRFAMQVASLLKLFDLRREYGRQMRHSEALLDAVQQLHGHRNADALAQALCDTAREVTSAVVAGLVRWNSSEQHGVVQAIAPGAEIEPGFHVTLDSLVGRVCTERLPLVMEDAETVSAEGCPYGGLPRAVGSFAIVPIVSDDQTIGAIVVEGKEKGDISQHEARNVGLLAALARGPLEVGWEIEEVSRRARTDALTGLANRRHFDEQLRRVVAETDRFGNTCSLILADLDHFKLVNDRYGHDAGDAVLRHVALVMGDTVRTVDLCARYGGEEIVLLLPQTSQAGAIELAERLRSLLENRPAFHNGIELRVTASFGIATYPTPVPYGDWLVSAADTALYEAKGAGRNCVKVVPPNNVTPALYRSRR